MKPISVGDMVQVVRPKPCCGNTKYIGHMFKVTLLEGPRATFCTDCQAEAAVVAGGHYCGRPIDIRRLKRIPPLDELEGKTQKEDLREPA